MTTKKSGFTLMELIVTIVIIGVLATLAIPRLSSNVERTRASEGVQILDTLLTAQRAYQFENGAFAGVIGLLDVAVSTPANFNAPPTVANDVTALATVERSTGEYNLKINSSGVIACTRLSGPADICQQAGY